VNAAVEVVGVVVPAHDEEEGIGACIAGIRTAVGNPALVDVPVHLVVVLDDCADATGTRAREALAGPSGSPGGSMTAAVVAISARNVGAARAFGAAHLFATLGAVDPETVWLATTDADSVVPADWLAHHLELRHGGADGCAGMVVVDSWQEHPPATQAVYEQHYWPRGRGDFQHQHVHGTNLGVSMAAYLDVGGFSDVATGEDHAIWAALIAAERRLVATPLAAVTTSGRRKGRSPAGFAGFLTQLDGLSA